jgi:hypothetical protein
LYVDDDEEDIFGREAGFVLFLPDACVERWKKISLEMRTVTQ